MIDSCMRSQDNTIQLILAELKREMKILKTDTTARLLIQDGKIAETCVYIKENLSNYLRDMFSTMEHTEEIDKLIIDTISNELNSLVRAEFMGENTSDLDVKIFECVDIKVVRDNGISYIVVRIKKDLKPFVNFTNGTNSNPYDDKKNVIDYMKGTNKPVAINAGLRGVTVKDGVSHIEANTNENEGFYILCFSPDGTMKALPRTATATEIISLGYRDAINIWSPIIEKGVFFDEHILDSNHEDYDYIFNQRHPRQVIGVLSNGDYIIITVDGRMIGEKGATFSDLKRIVQELGCVSAYNLDGGASTQTVVGQHLVNRKLSDSRTIGTVITFEGEVSNNARCVL